jgi:uncharacterized protein YaiL (DUF2058 family)
LNYGKNALQAQLLKAGLVDNKKAKKLTKQAQHEQRTGQNDDAELKAEIDRAKQEKLAKDQALNLEKQKILEEKALKASIIQMIKQHKVENTEGDIAYQFIDENKIKKFTSINKFIMRWYQVLLLSQKIRNNTHIYQRL